MKFLSSRSPIFTLAAIVFILGIFNYQPATFLTGWDNLHPEFNFAANIQRSFFAVWQEYQGLGLVGGMGHASDLPHQLILWILSLALPINLLRYFWTFLMLFVGSVGAYFLTKYILRAAGPARVTGPRATALVGGLFYLLNLATIQMFYTPFEAFIAFFGFLPWLLLTTINYLINPNRKSLLFLILVLILSIPAWYIPTLFVVYLLATALIILTIFILEKKREIIGRAVKLFTIILFINAFWLLPFAYFTINNSSVTVNAKINQMATEMTFLQNKEFGQIKDVMLLKGFWFDNLDLNLSGNPDYMLAPWRDHLNNPFISSIGFLFFAVIVIGVIKEIKERKTIPFVFVALFIFAFTMLVGATPPFSWANILFRKIPLFEQAFRSPFTKFSALASLTYAVFFAIGSSYLFQLLPSTVKKLPSNFYLLPSILLIVFAFPAFGGHLFYQKERLAIPQEYFALFNFFKTQDPNTRIANFPQASFWGWTFYNFGYSGSGLLWYGIKQPILDRAFDVWSQTDENYYFELQQALYAKDAKLFEQVLNKYQISWLLVDKNVINPSSPKALYFEELEAMIKKSNKISLTQQFGKIKIYKVKLDAPIKNFVYLAENLPTIEPVYKWNNYDRAYIDNNNYLSSITNYQLPITNYYPFRTLFTGKKQEDLEFSLEDRGGSFVFKKDVPHGFENYSLQIPDINTQELIWVDPKDLSKTKIVLPEVFFDGKIVEVKIPKVSGYFASDINPGLISKDCKDVMGGFLRLTLVDNANCTSFYLPNLSHNLSYLITAESENLSGQPILFWLENPNSRKSDIETYLPSSKLSALGSQPLISYFIQPPMEKDGVGYTLHFDNVSIGREKAVNTLGRITVNPIPFKFLTGLVLKKQLTTALAPVKLTKLDVSHPNPSLYIVNLEPFDFAQGKPTTLILSQSYDKGWKLYKIKNYESGIMNYVKDFFPFLFGEEITNHLLVNNWSNGWPLSPITYNLKPKTYVIIYLPQYLEYLGFVLLAAAITIPYLSTFFWRLIKRLK